MISKVISGQSFKRLCEYLCKDQDRSLVIDSEGVRDYHYALMANDFERQRCLNKHLKSPVLHMILSYYPGEQISDVLLVKIAREYLDRLGIQNTQLAIIKHTDRSHLHTHIIVNRIDNNGCTIKDGWMGYKAKKIAQALTAEYGLRQAAKKTPALTQLERRNEYEINRFLLYQKIHELLPTCWDLADLKSRLEKHEIQMHYKYKGQSNEIQGVSFQIGTFKYKGSEIDRQFSFLNLTKTMKQNLADHQRDRHHLRLKDKTRLFNEKISEPSDPKKTSLLEELIQPEQVDDFVPIELKRKRRKLKR
jgi:hypothetical protein